MALDRHSIVRKDFPHERRGYDPEAVDAHLSAVADEVEQLQRSAGPRSDTLASAAAERVRVIVEAAESTAEEIQRNAEENARQIRDEARAEIEAEKARIIEQAREQVGRIADATHGMAERIDSMERELGTVLESLRSGAGRLTDDLRHLQSQVSHVGGTIAPASGADRTPEPAPSGSVPPAEPAGEVPFEVEAQHPSEPAAEPTPEAAELDEVVGGGTLDPGHDLGTPTAGEEPVDDAEGARLIALNMALNGTPREETARYLSENFHLADAGGLLDEVYASVEG